MEFAVDKKGTGTNTDTPPFSKIFVSVDQVQEALLCRWMNTTKTGVNETWVQLLVNDKIFQFRRGYDTYPGKL